MRIAFISTILNYPWGGADTLWTRAAEAASDRGDALLVSVSSLTAEDPRVKALAVRGAKLHTRRPPTTPATFVQRLVRKLRSLTRFERDDLVGALQAFGPDLVIFSLGGTYDLVAHDGLIAWLESRRRPFRIIANWQAENPILAAADRTRAQRISRLADRIFFVSTRNLEVTRRHLLLPLPNAETIHNPLRWRESDRAPWPAAPGPLLATVSRLDEGKGIQLLLHALARLRDRHDWRLAIYGEGPARALILEIIDRLDLAGRVTLRDHVKDLRAVWSENQMLVSPSLDDGVPMTIPEAMLCGRPAIATAVGGAEDWIRHGNTGFLCPAPTLPLLVDTLEAALTARERWPEMGLSAAREAQARYRPDDYLKVIAPR